MWGGWYSGLLDGSGKSRAGRLWPSYRLRTTPDQSTDISVCLIRGTTHRILTVGFCLSPAPGYLCPDLGLSPACINILITCNNLVYTQISIQTFSLAYRTHKLTSKPRLSDTSTQRTDWLTQEEIVRPSDGYHLITYSVPSQVRYNLQEKFIFLFETISKLCFTINLKLTKVSSILSRHEILPGT